MIVGIEMVAADPEFMSWKFATEWKIQRERVIHMWRIDPRVHVESRRRRRVRAVVRLLKWNIADIDSSRTVLTRYCAPISINFPFSAFTLSSEELSL